MLAKYLAAGFVTVAGLLWVGSARADDVYRLNLPGDYQAPTRTLKAETADLNADVIDARWGYRGGWYGGYRGGFYGGYRGWYGGYRGWYGGYRGWYGGWYPRFWYPRYYASYYSPFSYSYPAYSYPAYSYYYPCAVTSPAPVVTLRVLPSTTTPLPPSLSTTPGANSGTFPYDGGPGTPVPMPRADDGSTMRSIPTKPAIAEERFVSLVDEKPGKWQYPAYGEKPTRQSNSKPTTTVIRGSLGR